MVATGISLMIPSHIRISKAINIHGSKDSIFALIKDQNRWRQWHPAFIPADSARNFPSIHITKINENDTAIIFKLQQSNKRPVLNGWQIYNLSADSLTLQWYMDFRIKWYPWQKFGSMFYENTYGVLMEQGLTNIKNLTEAH
jgi:hypothetical protein